MSSTYTVNNDAFLCIYAPFINPNCQPEVRRVAYTEMKKSVGLYQACRLFHFACCCLISEYQSVSTSINDNCSASVYLLR